MAGGCGELQFKKEKSKCPESKKDKKECKSKSKSSCSEKGNKDGKDEFGRKPCPKSGDKKGVECHESVKNFFEKKDKTDSDKCKSESKRQIDEKCGETTKKTKEECKKKKIKASSGEDSCKCVSSKEMRSDCGTSIKTSKKTASCNELSEKYVEFGPKSSANSLIGLEMPKPQVMTMKPCLPRVEKGIYSKSRKLSCFTPDIGCSQLQRPVMAEFFCIDARNQRMNECLKQCLSGDPGQITLQCAQYARRRPGMCGTAQLPAPPAPPGFLPPKYRKLARGWLPTAGLYLMATAALTVWMTEWGVVVKRIPYYRTEEAEEAQPQAPAATPAPPPSGSEEKS